MSSFAWILLSSLLMAAISLSGALVISFSRKRFNSIITLLVSFSAGALLAGAIVHLIPESIDKLSNNLSTSLLILAGIVLFYILEQFIHWHHCHRETREHVHPVSYLILIADTVHNFIDGLAVASAFIVGRSLGIAALIAVAAHEIPQELGDFGILIHSGWTVRKSLIFNFISSLSFFVGGIVAYFVSQSINISYLLPIAAGGFIYIAAVDLLPQVNKACEQKARFSHFFSFIFGILLLVALKILFE